MPGNAGIPVADAFRPGGLNWAFDSGRSFFYFALSGSCSGNKPKKSGCLPPVYQVGSANFID